MRTDLSKFVDVRKLKAARGSVESFTRLLEEVSNESGVDYLINMLKVSNILIEKFPSKKCRHLKKASLDFLKEKYLNEKKVEVFFREIDFIQGLYDELNFQIKKCDQGMSRSSRLSVFLIMLDSLYGSISLAGLKGDDDVEDICGAEEMFDEIFGVVKKKSSFYSRVLESEEGIEEGMVGVQHCLRFMTIQSNEVDLDGVYSKESVLHATKHFQFSEIKRFLDTIYEYWCYLGAKLRIDNEKVTISIDDSETYIAWYLANTRKKRIIQNAIFDERVKRFRRYNKKAQVLPPKEFVAEREFSTCLNIWEVFYNPKLDKVYCGLSLSIWLRAYSNLQNYAGMQLIKRLKKNSFFGKFTEAFEVKTKEEWCKILSGRGVSRLDLHKIFNCWVFNGNKSYEKADIFDQPFFQVADNKYALLVSVAYRIAPAICMESIFNGLGEINSSKNKGEGFEKVCGSIFDKSGLKYINNLKLYDDNHQPIAEYDFIFRIENKIYIVECKSKLSMFHFEKYYELYSDIAIEHVPKLNRNEKILLDKFSELEREYPCLFYDKDNVNIIKIVLCSTRLGQSLFYDGCYITDNANLIDIFENKAGRLRDTETGESIQEIFGAVNCPLHERMERGIIEPRPISILRKNTEIRNYTASILGYLIEFPQVDINIPSLGTFNELVNRIKT